MAEEVLKAIANPSNQAILNLLAVESSYPRRISDLLSLSETDVARRLKAMEGLGLVESEWRHIGKNVKVYRLVPDAVTVRFSPEGLRVALEAGADNGASGAVVLDRLRVRVPRPEGFVGRTDELATLRGDQPVVVVDGMPGIGKSSLVAAFAGGREDDGGGVFFHAFRGLESMTWLANRFAVFFARQGERDLLEAIEAGAEVPDQAELVLSTMDDERFTVVLDDVHQVEDEAVQGFLADAIGRVRQGKLVVAGRRRPRYDPTLDHVGTLRLEGLDDESVGAFLEARGYKVDGELLTRVRREVGGHPLALNLLVETAREMDVGIEGLLDLVPEKDLEEWLLSEVYEHLSDTERAVLAHASLFRTSFTTADLKAVYPRDPTGAIIKLHRRQLLQELGDVHGVHEVVRNFFYQRLDDPGPLHVKLADQYLKKGTIEARLEAMHHLLEGGKGDRVLRLVEEDLDLEDFDVIDVGYHNLYLAILERFDDTDVGHRQAALIQDEKGDIRFHRGEFGEALVHYAEAAAFFDEADEPERVADLAWKQALALVRLDKKADAKKHVKAGLAVAPKDGVARGRLETLKGEL